MKNGLFRKKGKETKTTTEVQERTPPTQDSNRLPREEGK